MSYNKLRSKLDRAIAAYLISVGAGAPADTVPNNSPAAKGYPNTTVHSINSKPEVPLTGLRRITIHITIKGQASTTPNDPNPDAARVAFDQRISDVSDALMQSNGDENSLRATAEAITTAGRALAVPVDQTPAALQVAANNADMPDFTCQAWYEAIEGDGEPDAAGASWVQVLVFEALCSPSNVD